MSSELHKKAISRITSTPEQKEAFLKKIKAKNKWPNRKYRIMQKIWYGTSIRSFYYNLKKGITNLIKWFPLVWEDRDWGQCYIYETLLFKIQNTRKEIEKKSHWHASFPQKVAPMIRCEELIKNLMLENYMERCGWIPKGQHKHERIEIIRKARELENAERKELFDLMFNHINEWWD